VPCPHIKSSVETKIVIKYVDMFNGIRLEGLLCLKDEWIGVQSDKCFTRQL